MNSARFSFLMCASVVLLSGCSSQTCRTTRVLPPAADQAQPEPIEIVPPIRDRPAVSSEQPVEVEPADAAWVSPFPNLRINTATRTIEIDGFVSRLIHDGLNGQEFYLEQFVCTPGTPRSGSKEHESLVATTALPSHLHAALLLLDLAPGKPVTWDGAGNVIPAVGPRIRVAFTYEQDGAPITVHPTAWIRHLGSGETMPERDWLFSGSTTKPSRGEFAYEADAAGTVIGLASFGGETLSWPTYISDDEATGDLNWLARTEVMPPAGTPVTITLRPVDE